ncbi:hypothetical protein AVEN_77499-1 [Araneus ventricosus]|uniref:Uncharacterized protein n=1 Tax=Araneus ventricosus TaxID=182803 RepID=A0A4Y2H9E4_ARAVE|nr:hypothetical protein AVEN_77499-1 [Araneus ventricosus]
MINNSFLYEYHQKRNKLLPITLKARNVIFKKQPSGYCCGKSGIMSESSQIPFVSRTTRNGSTKIISFLNIKNSAADKNPSVVTAASRCRFFASGCTDGIIADGQSRLGQLRAISYCSMNVQAAGTGKVKY